MKLDLTADNENTLKNVKEKIIVELESFCSEKLTDTISTSDLHFSFEGRLIMEENEGMTIEAFVNQVPINFLIFNKRSKN